METYGHYQFPHIGGRIYLWILWLVYKFHLNWKGKSYDSILVTTNWLTKMVHYKLVKVTVAAPAASASAPMTPMVKDPKSETRKRNNEAVEEAANKRKTSSQPPTEGTVSTASALPIKRKNMTKEQRSAQNKQEKKTSSKKQLPSNLAQRRPRMKARLTMGKA